MTSVLFIFSLFHFYSLKKSLRKGESAPTDCGYGVVIKVMSNLIKVTMAYIRTTFIPC